MRSFILLLCFVLAIPMMLQAAQRHDGGRGSVPCASAWIKRDGTVAYPLAIQWLEADYDCRPNDEELRAQLSESLLEFAATLLEDDCVGRSTALAAALAVAQRAAQIDPSNRRACQMVETFGQMLEISAQVERRIYGSAPRSLPEVAIPIPVGAIPMAVAIPNKPAPNAGKRP